MISAVLIVVLVSTSFALPPKYIDGVNTDWSAAELFQGGDNSVWGLSWNQTHFFVYVSSSQITTSTNRWIVVFIDTTPEPSPLSGWQNTYRSDNEGNGSTTGPTFNTQTPRLPFNSDYFLQWRTDDGFIRLNQFNGSSFANTGENVTRATNSVGSFVEMSMPLSALENPSAIYVVGCLIDETAFAEKSWASFPRSFTGNTYYPNIVWGTYYSMPLLTTNVVPNLKDLLGQDVFRDVYVSQTIGNGDWSDSAIWADGILPTNNSIACITSNAIATTSNDVSTLHLFVDTGASLNQTSGTIQLTEPASTFLVYGSFYSSGAVSPVRKFSTNRTPITFNDLNIREQTQIGGSFIKSSLTLFAGAYIDPGNQVTYLPNSVLRYTSNYVRYTEWNQTSGPGYPYHVIITGNGTVLGITNRNEFSPSLNLQVGGDLTVNSSCTLDATNYLANLTVQGNLVNSGTILMSRNATFTIVVDGTFTNTGNVICFNNSIYVNNVPFNTPQISPAGPINLQIGTSVRLSAPSGFRAYLWSTGAISQNITVNATGTYTVRVTDNGNCSATSPPVYVSNVATSGITVTSGSTVTTSMSTVPVVTTSRVTSGTPGPAIFTTGSLPVEPAKDDNRTAIIVGAVIGILILIIILIVAIILVVTRRRKPQEKMTRLKERESEIELTAPKEKNTEYQPLARSSSLYKVNANAAPSQTNYSDMSAMKKPNSWQIEYSDLKIKAEIASGQFGAVFLGRWRNADVAVKQIKGGVKVSQDLIEQFRLEVEVISSLRPHVNVVQFLAACLDPCCIVTEYMAKGDLRTYLRDHELELKDDQRLAWVKGTAAGMKHLHAESIVHRDLAARNILLAADLTPKIGDFGLSRVVEQADSGATTQAASGPVKWMAPESIMNREYSVLSDVWSFGVVIYEIYTCKNPYPDQYVAKFALGETSLELPNNVDASIKALFAQCRQHDKTKRPNFRVICDKLGLD